ncbi:MAG: PAS domain-containing protein [Sphingomonas sp.]|nr:PAS domain-containing protein [Sphingomonas sp.]
MAFKPQASGPLKGAALFKNDSNRPEVADGLAGALIASSDVPLLLLDGDQKVLAASRSFCAVYGGDPATVAGCDLAKLGAGEWAIPQLRALLRATASGNAAIDGYEMELAQPDGEPRKLMLTARRLDYGNDNSVHLTLSIADVTATRLALKAKDDLIREKAVLLQELQHRVANSLQIVASVLLLSARRVQSEETRVHLRDAHQRVMSVAAVQRQLAVTTMGDVKLANYMRDLCDSLGASMIRDHKLISIVVTVDESTTTADVSVSLGLIVTELVINALKHAFPSHRRGIINVSFETTGDSWVLAVGDNGVGVPTGEDAPKPGLGTSIIEAPANQLRAKVEMADLNPGTRVSIVHA